MENTLTDSRFIRACLQRLYARADRTFPPRYWQFKPLILMAFFSVVVQFPQYQYFYRYAVLHTGDNTIFNMFEKQVADPFVIHNSITDSHESKMVFRLTVPLLVEALLILPYDFFRSFLKNHRVE